MSLDGIAYIPPLLTGHSKEDDPRSETQRCGEGIFQVSRDDQNDVSLLAEVANGSREALTLLFRRHRHTVLKMAGRVLRDSAEAEDLCQEVFLLVFQKAKLFNATKGTPSSWINQMTYHRAIDRRRYLTFREHYDALQLNEELIRGKPNPPFIDDVFARQVIERLRDQLTTDQRQILELHFFEGYSLREIAEKTNQTLGNIRNHYYRGLERLRSVVFPKRARSSENLCMKSLGAQLPL
jgi:RNA polymerase sigma-70 factor (ECF subfamily)